MGQITELVKEAHETAIEHGWWEAAPEFGTLIALCHSELSEALEEYRKGNFPQDIRREPVVSPLIHVKTEGIPSELADTVIRIFDLCGYYGIDLETAILEKMKYNKVRPYRHGGKII